jgi:hypothetical protein
VRKELGELFNPDRMVLFCFLPVLWACQTVTKEVIKPIVKPAMAVYPDALLQTSRSIFGFSTSYQYKFIYCNLRFRKNRTE